MGFPLSVVDSGPKLSFQNHNGDPDPQPDLHSGRRPGHNRLVHLSEMGFNFLFSSVHLQNDTLEH